MGAVTMELNIREPKPETEPTRREFYDGKIPHLCRELIVDLDSYLAGGLDENQFLHAILFTRDELDRIVLGAVRTMVPKSL